MGRAATAMEKFASANEGGKKVVKWSRSDLERYARIANRETFGTPDRSIMTEFYKGLEEDRNQAGPALVH